MKKFGFFAITIILITLNCLNAKKSIFDISSPVGLINGLLFSFSQTTTSANTNTTLQQELAQPLPHQHLQQVLLLVTTTLPKP
ncbi:MAG: hypothetical protein SFU98_13790 [Leptospiraceae bacterium]|nr:hypothetical protein [Leptospiraceae bacterium]